MSPPNKNELIDELIRDIEGTAEQVHQLLKELHDSKIDLAVLKIELKNIVDSVKDLSRIIRDEGNGGQSVLTRIAIIERSIAEIKEKIKNFELLEKQILLLEKKVDYTQKHIEKKISEQDNNKKAQAITERTIVNTNLAGKWQLMVAIIVGICGIAGAVIAAILAL